VASAIEMFFDEHADAAVRRLWHRLTEVGLASLETRSHARHRLHVSLTVTTCLDGAHRGAVADVVADTVDQSLPRLTLSSLGTFAGDGGVLFLGAVVTVPVLALHKRVSDVMREQGLGQWSHDEPGAWVPHCTLAMELTPAEIASAIRLLADFQPIDAQVVEIGVTDTTTGAVTFLSR
jgi:2'-5' RNA ligase